MDCPHCDEICEVKNASRSELTVALVDHLRDEMGGAAAALIPVVDRAEEYVVLVMSKDAYERRQWPFPPNEKLRGG